MTEHQLSLEDAIQLKDAGIAQVLENADVEYRHQLYRAIQECAATGTTFSADHVRALAGEPPPGQSSNIIGAVFNHAAKAGLIRTVGFTRSSQVRGHANTIRLYKGAA